MAYQQANHGANVRETGKKQVTGDFFICTSTYVFVYNVRISKLHSTIYMEIVHD